MEKTSTEKSHDFTNDHPILQHYFGSPLYPPCTPLWHYKNILQAIGPVSDQSIILANLRKYCWSNHSKGSSFQNSGGEAPAARVHNIARNFTVYPIFRFYRRGPIFFLPAEIDFLNICFTKK